MGRPGACGEGRREVEQEERKKKKKKGCKRAGGERGSWGDEVANRCGHNALRVGKLTSLPILKFRGILSGINRLCF